MQLLQIDPNHSDALYLLGLVAHQSHRHDDAIALVERAIELQPRSATFHNTLGDAYRLRGRLEEAERALRRALALAPASRDAATNLALVLQAQERHEDALPLLLDTLATYGDHEPWPPLLRSIAVQALGRAALTDVTASTRATLLRMCNDSGISMTALTEPVLKLICETPAFSELEQLAARADTARDITSRTFHDFACDPLLLALLPRIAVADETMERVLTFARRTLLELVATSGAHRIDLLPFACALAQQCFNSEYSWSVRDDERRLLREMESARTRVVSRPTHDAREIELAIASAYEPLTSSADIESIAAQPTDRWSAPFRAVVTQQVIEPRRELQLAEALPSLTPVSDAVSRVVREMYEANPYPRWVDLERPGVLHTRQFIASITGRTARDSGTRPSILVAGCGTGRQPIQIALQFDDSDVLAIDLSRASLGYAVREAIEYRVANLTFAHADLLELDLPDRAFTMISCSGVLHHLSDPLAGWRRLLDHLAPGGVMKIGLYSTLARQSVEAARAFVAAGGFTASPDDMRACRQAILALPLDHVARRVTRFPDFFSVSGCRDLIMHVQERTYSISELASSLDALGLRFLGFQTDGVTQARFASMYSAADASADLANWDAYERAYPDTFAGMYQLWCDRR